MGTVTNVEIGSLVYNMITGIPVNISGILTELVNQSIYTAEVITGVNIPLTGIQEPYQPGITNLTAGTVLSLMEAQGVGTKMVKIDELTLSKGIVEGTSKSLKELGISQLKGTGETIVSYQTWN